MSCHTGSERLHGAEENKTTDSCVQLPTHLQPISIPTKNSLNKPPCQFVINFQCFTENVCFHSDEPGEQVTRCSRHVFGHDQHRLTWIMWNEGSCPSTCVSIVMLC